MILPVNLDVREGRPGLLILRRVVDVRVHRRQVVREKVTGTRVMVVPVTQRIKQETMESLSALVEAGEDQNALSDM